MKAANAVLSAANDNNSGVWLTVQELVRLGYVEAGDARVLEAILNSALGDRVLVRGVSACL